MKNILLLFILTLLSCNSKKKEEVIRQQESIIIIQTLLEERGLEMVRDSYSEQKLPICLNLKKNIVNTKCFEKIKANDEVVEIQFPEKTFTRLGGVCIEKLYGSKSIDNSFFLKNDSLDIVKQNETIKALKIPKRVTQKFTTVELTESLKVIEKYVQFSIPIFSKDNTKAYLEFDYYSDEISSGISMYLEKVNGKWKIKYIERNWDT
ncbi:hypothetical protein [Myroides sp. WP-1]|uniref:hypothetical protein n=1 Tax=Myroides sp. WP-1 TaxID=2759944 RepID=UPI0015F79B9B|nr:hypothetical protein [Myroides sp. WP-1]MBB1139015.1 hypothetical protein [Myroides sp. WP-1]